MGRNFDFPSNPALLLYTDPPDGYASVSMVDLGYFGCSMSSLPEPGSLDSLLAAPYMPFDGMNEKGLVIGMAAIPESVSPRREGNTLIGEIQVVRLMLDRAADVEEALRLLGEYDVEMMTPPIHYMLANAEGNSVIIEFIDGHMHLVREPTGYQVMTNFIVHGSGAPEDSPCWRYNAVHDGLSMCGGAVSATEAIGLLSDSSQSSTIWSTVYCPATGEIHVAMGADFETAHTFTLNMTR